MPFPVAQTQALSRGLEGITPTRYDTPEESAAYDADAATHGGGAGTSAAGDAAAASSDDTDYATGIDGFDVAIDAEGHEVDVDACQSRAAHRCLTSLLGGATLVSTAAGGRGLLSDYDRDFGPLTHPSVFPYGEGGRPAVGMSEDAYFRLVLERRSASCRGDNIGLLLAFYDIHTRHTVNNMTQVCPVCAVLPTKCGASAQLASTLTTVNVTAMLAMQARARATPEVFADLARLDLGDMQRLFTALNVGKTRARKQCVTVKRTRRVSWLSHSVMTVRLAGPSVMRV
jgi:hypothetical protein